MINLHTVNTKQKEDVQRFIALALRLYENHPLWVPPIRMDIKTRLDFDKHPFYEHSEAAFFIAERNQQDVGRIAVIENKPYNRYHEKKQAQFYYFECIEDVEVASALFERAFAWAQESGQRVSVLWMDMACWSRGTSFGPR
jgi:hypothetical protein